MPELSGYTDGIFRAIGILFSAGVIYGAYKVSYDGAVKAKKLWIYAIKGLFVAIVITLFANATLGSHTENCDDYLYGSCDTVQDFEPTSKQYRENFAYWLTLIGTPIIVGAFNGGKKRY